MSRIRIVHRTGYRYGGAGATASFNEVRMTPLSTHEQLTMSNRIEISPTPWQNAYVDYWGTPVLAFEVQEAHHSLRITASSEVDVHRPAEARESVLAWDELALPEVSDRFCEYLGVSEYTTVGGELMARAAELRGESATPAAFAAALSSEVGRRIAVTGSGKPSFHASEAWEKRSGVRQDVAHLLVGSLRSQGVPARFVAGYLLPDMDLVGVAQRANLHAWVQFWDGAWVGLDPVLGTIPGEGHVEVGYGRDHHDGMPLSGIFTGGETSETFVDVELTRVA